MSTDGKIRNLNYRKSGNTKELKQSLLGPYYSVNLDLGLTRKRFRIHQLMAITFLGFVPDGMVLVVDHINNDKLDNRLDNLQIISHRENSSKDKNRNLPTGVCFQPGRKKPYRSIININRKRINIGYFSTQQEASEAYKIELKKLKNAQK